MALHMLGVIAHHAGKNDIAVDLIMKALALKPDFTSAYNSLGNALKGLRRLDEAVDQYRKALDFSPDFILAHINLGSALRELGRPEDAVAHYQSAIDIKPDFAEAHYNLGNALTELGRLDEAVDHYRKALASKPSFVEAHYNLGNALRELGKLDEAVDHYRHAIHIQPNHTAAYNNLGNVLLDLERFEDAVRYFDLAATDSSRSKILECLFALERYEDFYRRLDKLIEADQNDIRAAAISAFASQQLGRADPFPFCRKPMDFVRVYENLNVADNEEEFLRRLAKELKSRTVNWEPQGKTTQKGFQSPADLFANPTGLLADLDRLIKDKVEYYRGEFASANCGFMEFFPDNPSLSGWAVRLLEGGHQSEHIHPGGWLIPLSAA
jgi:tetratricopeptide (TPR) repeat protein